MSYESNDPRITAFLFDELEVEERIEFEAALKASPELQQLVRETRATIGHVETELKAETDERLTGKQRAEIDAACRGTADRPAVAVKQRDRTNWRRLAGWIGGGAVAAAIGLVVFWNTNRSSSQLASLDLKNGDIELQFGNVKDSVEFKDRSKKFQQLTSNTPHAAKEDYGFSAASLVTNKEIGGVEAFSANQVLLDNQSRGEGPGMAGDRFDLIIENEFRRVLDAALSTFSIDVDTASYSKVRMFLQDHGQLPREDAVRIEELINYFPYAYACPEGPHPFAAHLAVSNCPWNPKHHLVRIGIKGREIEDQQRPASNLVFLLDVSGSMDEPNKLPLLKRGMKMLVDQLGENDRVAIVVYAGAAGLALESTNAEQKTTILNALDRLDAGGSTNGGEGILLAYQTALDNFIEGGVNRVILCTDGDFNIGITGTDELVRTVEKHAKSGVFLTVLGFGMGNHNDAMLEQISNQGNGNYALVDNENEARKVLVEQTSSTLVTIAKDVKIQVEFNPKKISSYRLVGYENRVLADEDFNDDTKDAGEIGAGHTVTALYEIVPASATEQLDVPPVDPLRYQSTRQTTESADGDELLTLKIRYKQPDGDTSTLMSSTLADEVVSFNRADREFQFAAAVASFGMLLRDSQFKGNSTYASVIEIAMPAAEQDGSGYRAEFLELVRSAAKLAGE